MRGVPGKINIFPPNKNFPPGLIQMLLLLELLLLLLLLLLLYKYIIKSIQQKQQQQLQQQQQHLDKSRRKFQFFRYPVLRYPFG